MNEITTTVIIPTLNRSEHLRKTLHSLLEQTILPNEIIIVDQSDDSKTKDLVAEERLVFSSRKTCLRYIGEGEKSLVHARNVGMRAATGKFVFFLDDDMIPNKNYIEEILNVYRRCPDAVGVQGLLIERSTYWEGTSTKSILINSIRKVFLVTHWEKDRQEVLRSGDMIVPHPLTKTIEARIIYPAISSFKRGIAKKFQFDEYLKGYSWGEEYFSLQLDLRYPRSLYVTPFARVFHDHATGGRPAGKWLYYIYSAYELYNFSQNISSSLENWTAFFWKSIGKAIITLLGLHRVENRKRLVYTLQSYLWTLHHFEEVRNGDFSHIL